MADPHAVVDQATVAKSVTHLDYNLLAAGFIAGHFSMDLASGRVVADPSMYNLYKSKRAVIQLDVLGGLSDSHLSPDK